jgi:hypothetical protein
MRDRYRPEDFYDKNGKFHAASDRSYVLPHVPHKETAAERAVREKNRAELEHRHKIAFHQKRVNEIRRKGPGF